MLGAVFLSEVFRESFVFLFSILPFVSSANIPDSVPAFTVFTLLYYGFNQWGWKLPVIQRVTKPPNLSGEWNGEVASSYDRLEAAAPLASDGGDLPRLSIKQTWSHIKIEMETASSFSESTSAAFLTNNNDPVLRITYYNRPKALTEEEMTPHEGTNDLRFQRRSDGSLELQGSYYTDQYRNNHGQVQFMKQSSRWRDLIDRPR